MFQEAPKYIVEKGKLYFSVFSLANEQKIIESVKKSFKYGNRLETKTFPLKGEFQEFSINYLKKLHEQGKIKLTQKGSRLC